MLGRVGIIKVEVLADVRKAKSQTLAPQDELQTTALPVGIDPRGAGPARRQQALTLIKADRRAVMPVSRASSVIVSMSLIMAVMSWRIPAVSQLLLRPAPFWRVCR